jgi:hypothetical protein
LIICFALSSCLSEKDIDYSQVQAPKHKLIGKWSWSPELDKSLDPKAKEKNDYILEFKENNILKLTHLYDSKGENDIYTDAYVYKFLDEETATLDYDNDVNARRVSLKISLKSQDTIRLECFILISPNLMY